MQTEPMQPGSFDVAALENLTPDALVKTSYLLHEFYEDFFVGNELEKAEGVTRKEVVLAEIFLTRAIQEKHLTPICDELSGVAIAKVDALIKAQKARVEYRFVDKSVFIDVHTPTQSWSLDVQRNELAIAPDDALVKKVTRSFNLDGDRYIHAFREPCAASASPYDKPAAPELAKTAEVDVGGVEEGLHIPSTSGSDGTDYEYFITGKVLKGTLLVSHLEDDQHAATVSKSCLPRVLTRKAVSDKLMPVEGKSGMPASLERAVAPEFQFWKAAGEDARKIRDALVAEQFFDDDNVRIVNGEYCRVVTKTYIYVPPEVVKDDGVPTPPATHRSKHVDTIVGKRDYALVTPPEGGTSWSAWLSDIAKQVDTETVLVITDSREDADISTIVSASVKLEHDYAIGLLDDNDGAARTALVKIGSPFKHHSDGDFVWVYSGAVAKAKDVVFLDSAEILSLEDLLDRPVEVVERTKAEKAADSLFKGRIVKTLMPEEGAVEERFVLGIVLEPEKVDLQNDIYSVAEIRQAAHKFMEEFQNMGFMHTEIVNDQVHLLESYLMPVTGTIAGVEILEGTWLMGVRVLDDELWEAIKNGEFTGFSIGGSAIRVADKPEDATQEAA